MPVWGLRLRLDGVADGTIIRSLANVVEIAKAERLPDLKSILVEQALHPITRTLGAPARLWCTYRIASSPWLSRSTGSVFARPTSDLSEPVRHR